MCKISLFLSSSYLILTLSLQAQNSTIELKGEYIGQEKPGLTPKIFAPGFISTKEHSEISAFLHPNGKEFYYTLIGGAYENYTLMVCKQVDGKWSKPHPLMDADGMVPVITKDGQKLFYGSIELTDENDTKREPNLWVMVREGDDWGNPKPLDSDVNTPDGGEWFPSIADNGTLYFKSGNFMEGTEKLYYSEVKNGSYQKAKPVAFTSEYFTEDPFMAPDESYVIFSPAGPKLFGPMHISFRDEQGNWSKPKDMGLEGTLPSLSPNREYLFFIKNEDVYWVDAQVIESLR